MNSLGVQPYVHYLYSDLQDGLVYFKLYDIIRPGVVNWKKVIQKFNKLKINFEKLGNQISPNWYYFTFEWKYWKFHQQTCKYDITVRLQKTVIMW